jgi:riboflavin kinase/FMN adenylyltransferase
MQLLQDWKHFPAEFRGGVLCVGNFDGVHRGHARMLATGRAQATARRRPFTIMTFEPHPSLLLKPGVPRFPLTTLDQRLELLGAFRPDALLVVPTTRAFLAMPAEDFLRDVVAGESGGVGASLLVEGPTFTYGRGAKGTVETLQGDRGARAFAIETLIVPTQEASLTDLTRVNVSSSVIRWLIAQGRVADAARALGRPYALRGAVVPGAGRGQAIGFPTANLRTPQLVPAPGVYAGTATVDGHTCGAAISVGDNPTFDAGHTTIEAYLLDFSGDLYGRTIDMALHRWIREMFSFAGAGPLADQLRRDVQWTRRVLAADPTLLSPAVAGA